MRRMLALELLADGAGDVRHHLAERQQQVVERHDPGESAITNAPTESIVI